MVLAQTLENNSTLSLMDLGNASMGDEGAIALAEALKLNTALTLISAFIE